MFSAQTQMAKAAVCEVDSAITVKLQMGIPGGHVSFFFFPIIILPPVYMVH